MVIHWGGGGGGGDQSHGVGAIAATMSHAKYYF